MYRTLKELKESVENLIEQQGEDSVCAAFIFTKNDVFYFKNGEDGYPDLNEEFSLNEEFTSTVLSEVGESDHIYEQIGEIICDEVSRVLKTINTN